MPVIFNRPETVGNVVMVTGKFVPQVNPVNHRLIVPSSIDFSPYFRELIDVKYVVERGKQLTVVKVGSGISGGAVANTELNTTADKAGSTGTGLTLSFSVSGGAVNLNKPVNVLKQGSGYKMGEIITADAGAGANNPKFMVMPQCFEIAANHSSEASALIRGSDPLQEFSISRKRVTNQVLIPDGEDKTVYGYGSSDNDAWIGNRLIKFVAFGRK